MKKCSVGGQAVMEGVMMKAPGGIAMAVRDAKGRIILDYKEYQTKAQKGTFYGLPIVRGVVAFVESLTIGMNTLTRSAELIGDPIDEEPTKFEKWLSEKLGKSVEKVVMGLAVILAVALAVGLFFLLPQFISSLIFRGSAAASATKCLVEGLVRLCIFIGYIFFCASVKDIKRVFMYHGAEHKTIACYEAEDPLTPENAMKHSRLHPRCGTNYLFLVMAVSIVFFAVVGWNESFWLRLLSRIVFLPLVAGISYEVLKLAAKYENIFTKIIRAPGMDNCAINIDAMILPDESVSIIEAAGRCGATGIPEVISGYTGRDYYSCIIDAALGRPIAPFDLTHGTPTASQLLYTERSGILREIRYRFAGREYVNENAVVPGVGKVELSFAPGDDIDAFRNGTDRIGQAIFQAASNDELQAAVKAFRESLRVEVCQ